LRLVRVDVYRHFEEVLANPGQYGFTETRLDVLADFFLFDKRFNGPGRNYIFWDPIHPTTKAHALLADWFEAALENLENSEPVRLRLSRGPDGLWLSAISLQPGRSYQIQRSTNLVTWTNYNSFTALTNRFDLNLPNALLPFEVFR
jgi:phospholipase/lecithinase/hemolysin